MTYNVPYHAAAEHLTLGALIKHLRESERLSIVELARDAGIGVGDLAVLEHSNVAPCPETLRRLSRRLSFPLPELLIAAGIVTRAELITWQQATKQ